jgi:hypothetical protein
MTHERERDERWTSISGTKAGGSAESIERPVARKHRLGRMIKAHPLRCALWLIVPSITAATELSHRFDTATAIVLGVLIGAAVGSTVLLATARGWIPGDSRP